MKQQGEITVFLTLMLSVLAAFVIFLAGKVRLYASKSEAVCAIDNAVRSCFAEYNRELFNRFHILLIDSSYKGIEAGTDPVASHFSVYLENSMTKNEVCGVRIEDCRNASDDEGYLYDEAVRYSRSELNIDDRIGKESDDAYFLTYLMDVCGNDDIPHGSAYRKGEIEYLICGCASDDENIRWAHIGHGGNEETTYEEYLLDCLMQEDISIVKARFSELVTEYMRQNGSPGFDLSNCYYDITFLADIKSSASEPFSITREYSYVPAVM